MNADRIKPAPPPIRDKKRWRRLKTQIAKEIDRGERIQNRYDLVAGYAYPDGRFETVRADNFRYARQLLAGLAGLDGLDREAKTNLIKAARYIRRDEVAFRAKEARGAKRQVIDRIGLP